LPTGPQYVVAAERNAVELAPERVADGACRSDDRADLCHRDLPDWSNPGAMRERKTSEVGASPLLRMGFKVADYSWIDASRIPGLDASCHRVDVLLLFQISGVFARLVGRSQRTDLLSRSIAGDCHLTTITPGYICSQAVVDQKPAVLPGVISEIDIWRAAD
jgi:hypothetical protein